MNELTLDGQIYVSSKQAAQMTGYAKDYVGQLCREGRVSARLVGRNWYVLKSAINDHRFGPKEEVQGIGLEPAEEATEAVAALTYEPESVDLEQAGAQGPVTTSMQSAWEEWFNSIRKDSDKIESLPVVDEIADSHEPSYEAPASVDLKLMKIYRSQDIENLGETRYEANKEDLELDNSVRVSSPSSFRAVTAALVVIILGAAALAYIGSGVAYQQGVSYGALNSLAGVSFYSK